MSRPSKDAIIAELWELVRHQGQLIRDMTAAREAMSLAVPVAPATAAPAGPRGFETLASAAYATDGPEAEPEVAGAIPEGRLSISWQKPPKPATPEKDAEA